MSGDTLSARPFGRSLSDFEPLQPAEQRLLEAVRRGDVLEIAQSRPTERTADNAVRAGFIRFLALGGDDNAPVHERGVVLRGAFVEGEFDLISTKVVRNLALVYCHFDKIISFMDAEIRGLVSLKGSRVPGLVADRASITSNLFLSSGFVCEGEVRLLGAKIGGQWSCKEGVFANLTGDALSADSIVVAGNVFMGEGFRAGGAVRLPGAKIGGQWNCDGGVFANLGGQAVFADGIEVAGIVSMGMGFKASGEVRLLGAKIGMKWICNRGVFNNPQSDALSADGIEVTQDVSMGEGFEASGEVRLLGAVIGGNWQCNGGIFNNPTGDALSANRINVGGSVIFGAQFRSSGAVRFLGAKIRGDWICNGGVFSNPTGDALTADKTEVGGSVSMSAGFQSRGEVRLSGAEIRGQWVCDGGVFANPTGNAIRADGVSVGNGISMSARFQSSGEVRLLGAKISGQWVCNGGVFINPTGNALSADEIEVRGYVSFGNGFQSSGNVRLPGARFGGNFGIGEGHYSSITMPRAHVQGALELRAKVAKIQAINLSFAHVGVLIDSNDVWPDDATLDGFEYGSFGGGSPVEGKDRIAWLGRQSSSDKGDTGSGAGFKPQPWIQARKVLREMGHYEAAREVGIAFETRKRKIGLIGGTSVAVPWWCPKRVWPLARRVYRVTAERLHWGYGFLVDYGYQPLKLVFISTLLWGLCALSFYYASTHGIFAPTDPLIYQNPAYAACVGHWTNCSVLNPAYTTFYAPVYSLNVLLPVGDLGEVSSWAPMTSGWGLAVQVAVWFETLFGWVAGLLLIAVVTGLVKRDE